MLVELIGLVLTLIFTYNFYKYQTVWRFVNKIPGPRACPIVGNALEVGSNPVEYLKSLIKWWREYDCDMYRIWIGTDLYVIISNPKDVEAILSSTTLLKKGPLYEILYPWLGEGLLTSHGTKWRKRRKMITPSFHFKILIDFLDVMNKGSNKFIEKLKEKAKEGNVFDVQKMIHLCTLDVICETAMGVEMNSMDNPNSEIVNAYQTICYTMQDRFFDPIKKNNWTYKLTKDCQKQNRSLDILKSFTNEVIEKRRKNMLNIDHSNEDVADPSFSKPKKAFLDTLLNATIDGKPLTLEEIAEEVSTFAFEGHDTTKAGISFAVYLLSRHKNIQQKVYEEQLEIFGSDMDRAATYQEIQEMKYLELFIKEAQRLYPSVPMIARQNEGNYNLNGTIIPANSNLVVFIMAMGYNEKFFKDPFKVDPERFDPSNREHSNPYEYVPFSAGPRNCIGQKFAMLEMKTVLSKIVRNFEILHPSEDYAKNGSNDSENDGKVAREPEHILKGRHDKSHDPILSAVLTLQADKGIYIRLRARHEK